MRLASGGVDVVYIDESMDQNVFAMSAVAVPLLRQVEGIWTFVWKDHLDSAKAWRKRARAASGIPAMKELKGSKLASGHGNYLQGSRQMTRAGGTAAYAALLADLGWLQPMAVISVAGSRTSNLYGHTKLEALLYAMLQRQRRAHVATSRNGLIFFDEGHGEYRRLYRKACVYLPTGSSQGSWPGGSATANMPLDNFTKDANIKDSKHSLFIQVADLVSYAAFAHVRASVSPGGAPAQGAGLGNLYSAIPQAALNLRAQRNAVLGIVRL